MTTRLTIIVFPGGANLPLWTGIKQGFFAKHGLEVVPSYTRSSVEQISGLVSGQWDLGLTGFDNIVAYQEGQGEAKLDRQPDLFAFMGGDNAFLRLVVQKQITSYADLKGKALSVDALTTGFAFVGAATGEHSTSESTDARSTGRCTGRCTVGTVSRLTA